MQENTGKYMKLLLFIPWPVTLNYHLPVSLHKNETAQGESTMAVSYTHLTLPTIYSV